MGLFKQDILVKLENDNHIVEKKVFDLKKGTIKIKIEEGAQAFFGSEKLLGGETYTYSKKVFGDSVTVLVYQKNKTLDAISFNFSSGEFTLALDELEGAKAKYCLNGTVSVELFNIEKLAKYFNKDISLDDIVLELQNTVRDSFSTEVRSVASKYLNSQITLNLAYQDFDKIKKEVAGKDIACVQKLVQMGLDLSAASISLKLTPVKNTEDLVEKVNDKINQTVLDQLDERKADKEREQRLEEKEMDQNHEVNVIRAQNTKITETKIDSNAGLPKNEESHAEVKEKFCQYCGTKLNTNAKFCSSCGKNVE